VQSDNLTYFDVFRAVFNCDPIVIGDISIDTCIEGWTQQDSLSYLGITSEQADFLLSLTPESLAWGIVSTQTLTDQDIQLILQVNEMPQEDLIDLAGISALLEEGQNLQSQLNETQIPTEAGGIYFPELAEVNDRANGFADEFEALLAIFLSIDWPLPGIGEGSGSLGRLLRILAILAAWLTVILALISTLVDEVDLCDNLQPPQDPPMTVAVVVGNTGNIRPTQSTINVERMLKYARRICKGLPIYEGPTTYYRQGVNAPVYTTERLIADGHTRFVAHRFMRIPYQLIPFEESEKADLLEEDWNDFQTTSWEAMTWDWDPDLGGPLIGD